MNLSQSCIKPLIPYNQILQNNEWSGQNFFAANMLEKQIHTAYTEQYQHVKILTPLYQNADKNNCLLHVDVLFIAGLILFGWTTYIKIQFPHAFKQLFKSLFNFQHARQLINEKSGIVQKLSINLMILFSFSASMFLLSIIYKFVNPQIVIYKAFLMIFIFVLLFLGIKYALYFGVGYLTDTLKQTIIVVNHFNVFYRILAVVLLPLSLILFYIDYRIVNLFFILSFLLFIGFYLMRLYRGFILCKQMKFSYLFFFIYLCTLEIIPLIYAVKTFIMWS